MKHLFFFLLFSTFCNAQKVLPFDSLKLKDVKDLLADDYGNIYLYSTKDFSVTKYDSLGRQRSKLMLTVPFRIQNVQNPLNIALFSKNSQEIRLIDQNLNEIQKINLLSGFGFITNAYVEDQQQMWLLDDASKRLVQYNFREQKIINSYSVQMDFEEIIDFIVFNGRFYCLTENRFRIYTLKGELKFEASGENFRRLRRENDVFYILGKNQVFRFSGENTFKTVFSSTDSKIVDKNSDSYFELNGNKLYLYRNIIPK